MKPAHVLLLDHEPTRREGLVAVLRAAGHLPVVVTDAASAARALDVPGLDLAIIDLSDAGLDTGLLRQALLPAEPAPPDSLEAAERRHLVRALRFTQGNRRQAALLLGIARSTLLAKLRKYGLEEEGIEPQFTRTRP